MTASYDTATISPYREFHDQSTSIVLIGGAGGGLDDFAPAVPFFSDYHVLCTSPTHPYSLPRNAAEIANLVRQKAKNGRAHVVGLSLGAHIACLLAAEYPEVVETLFLSGFNRVTPGFWTPVFPYGAFAIEKTASFFAGGKKSATKDDQEARGLTLAAAKDTFAVLTSEADLPTPRARALVVAATKGHGIIPTGDGIDSSRLLFNAARRGSSESRLMEAKQGRHAWCNEQSEEFAECLISWIRGDENLPGFLTPL